MHAERSPGFEPVAAEWLAWARTPGHDAYWRFRDAFFELLPAPGRATLEIGCGEGRVARDLAARGHRVTAVDVSETLLAAAREADRDGTYVAAPAEELPFPDESFELVVAYNALMDVEDLQQTLRQAARVLEPGGALCVCITHPFQEVLAPSAAGFTFRHPYLAGGPVEVEIERDGLRMPFRSRHEPLETYVASLLAAGFALEALREPRDPAGTPPWDALPMFLMLRTVKR